MASHRHVSSDVHELQQRIAVLEQNNETLHQRIAELEHNTAALHQHIADLENNEQRFISFMDHLPGAAFINSSTTCVTYANDWYFRQFGWNPADVLNRPYHDILPPKMAAYFAEQDQDVLVNNAVRVYEDVVDMPTGTRYYLTTKFPIPKPDGSADIGGFTLDITERKQAEQAMQQIEQERLQFQQELIEAQQAAIRELSTPLIPLTKTVVLMPLVGTLDSRRTQQVMETLLEGVAARQADTVILDITGVQIVDTQVANALIQATQAVRLLGAQIMLTGIGPVIAQTMVHLGIDLHSIHTQSNLEQAIRTVLRSAGEHNDRA